MKRVFSFILLGFAIFSSSFLFAAGGPPPPPGGGGSPPCWPPSSCIPIDGGISFLIIAGAAYGGKKILDSRRKP